MRTARTQVSNPALRYASPTPVAIAACAPYDSHATDGSRSSLYVCRVRSAASCLTKPALFAARTRPGRLRLRRCPPSASAPGPIPARSRSCRSSAASATPAGEAGNRASSSRAHPVVACAPPSASSTPSTVPSESLGKPGSSSAAKWFARVEYGPENTSAPVPESTTARWNTRSMDAEGWWIDSTTVV